MDTTAAIDDFDMGNISTLSNFSFDLDTIELKPNRPWYLLYIFFPLYIIIFILGITGNIMVMVAVVIKKSAQRFEHLFILSMAIADFTMCLTSLPMAPVAAYLGTWPFGSIPCHLYPLAISTCIYVPCLTCAASAACCYFVSVHRSQIKLSSVFIAIVAIWGAAVVASSPLAIFQSLEEITPVTMYVCVERWPSQTARSIFTVVSLTLQFVIPGCVVAHSCYMAHNILQRSRCTQDSGDVWSSSEMNAYQMRRTIKVIITISVLLTFCWAPISIFHLLMEHVHQIQTMINIQAVYYAMHIIAMCSVAYKPAVYWCMDNDFRNAFHRKPRVTSERRG
jgi:hypothetical protein